MSIANVTMDLDRLMEQENEKTYHVKKQKAKDVGNSVAEDDNEYEESDKEEEEEDNAATP